MAQLLKWNFRHLRTLVNLKLAFPTLLLNLFSIARLGCSSEAIVELNKFSRFMSSRASISSLEQDAISELESLLEALESCSEGLAREKILNKILMQFSTLSNSFSILDQTSITSVFIFLCKKVLSILKIDQRTRENFIKSVYLKKKWRDRYRIGKRVLVAVGVIMAILKSLKVIDKSWWIFSHRWIGIFKNEKSGNSYSKAAKKDDYKCIVIRFCENNGLKLELADGKSLKFHKGDTCDE